MLKHLVLAVMRVHDGRSKLIRDIHKGTAERLEAALWQSPTDKALDIVKLGSNGSTLMIGRVSGVET